jgi:hypothetical protein
VDEVVEVEEAVVVAQEEVVLVVAPEINIM